MDSRCIYECGQKCIVLYILNYHPWRIIMYTYHLVVKRMHFVKPSLPGRPMNVRFKTTHGLDSDQTVSAIKATTKMLNQI